jgi:hypothetical protein
VKNLLKRTAQILAMVGIGALRGLMYVLPIAIMTSLFGLPGALLSAAAVILVELSWTHLQKTGGKNWKPVAVLLAPTIALPYLAEFMVTLWPTMLLWLGLVAIGFSLFWVKDYFDQHSGPLPAWIQNAYCAFDAIF